MIEFRKLTPEDRERYDRLLFESGERGCEFTFANLYLWGRQRIAFIHDHAVLFSQFDRRTVYPFPVGGGDKRAALEAVMADAHQRDIPCRFTGLTERDIRLLEELYPGRFFFHCDRDSYDYVYAIDDLAELKGKKYQKKRNHVNRFRAAHPDCRVQPLSAENLEGVKALVDGWYESRLAQDPTADFLMERRALEKALRDYEKLGMESLVLLEGERVLAFTMGASWQKTPWMSTLKRPGRMWTAPMLPSTAPLPAISGKNIPRCSFSTGRRTWVCPACARPRKATCPIT